MSAFSKFLRIFLLTCFLVPVLADFEAEQKFAEHFCELQAHVELAKTCFNEGQELTAFFILERARSVLFDPKRFLIVFDHVFHQKPLADFTEDDLQFLLALPDDPETEIPKWESVLQYHLLKENFREALQVLSILRERHPDVYRYALQSDQVEALLTGQSTRKFREHFFERNPSSFETLFYEDEETEVETGADVEKAESLLKTFPDRVELKAWLAGKAAKEGESSRAEILFAETLKNPAHNAVLLAQAGSFYEGVKHDVDLALKTCLSAYFEDPECGSPVPVAQKIKDLANRQASALYEIVERTKPAEHALSSPNPKLQILLLEWLADQDAKSRKNIFLQSLRNRDATARWRACEILIEEHLLSRAEIETLLQSEHPFEKGLALYMALASNHPQAESALKNALQSGVELFRFDAISALIQSGKSENAALIREHLKTEKNPWLCALIQNWLDTQKPASPDPHAPGS